MFTDLNVFRMAYAQAVHSGQRQAVIARNVANADTPGYKARDIAVFDRIISGTFNGMRASRPNHINASAIPGPRWEEVTPVTSADPNENSVSVEQEMLKGVDVKRQHDRALAIYRSSLRVLRTSIGRG